MELTQNWRVTGGDGGIHAFDIQAKVPGVIHTDLQRAGLLGDLYSRDNAENCQWVEGCDITYSCRFGWEKTENGVDLVFEGLDTYASVRLNGCELGKTDDMFISYRYPVESILREGENLLEVSFTSPLKPVAGKPKRSGAFTTERLYTRRIQCTYGWDWVGRFVTMGIWRPVRLEERYSDRLGESYVYTSSVNRYAAQIGIETDFKDVTGDGWVKYCVNDPDGHPVWQKERRILPEIKGENRVTLRENVNIRAPELWYPAGYGEQPLYTLTVICGKQEKHISFGIRTVELLELEDLPESPEALKALEYKKYEHLQEWDKNQGSSCFILLINGKRIFCKGANWVPCEPFPSEETPEKIGRLVHLAREGNYNMLRVWGGGIFEQQAFYNACDREGILVTQDFLMACGNYPEEDDGFIGKLSLEAEEAAIALRNHPSLVWWSGDNENAVAGDENMPDYTGRRAALEGIAPILRRLDPNRRFLPSSPYGGKPYASAVRGTTHNTQYLGNFFAWVRKGDFSDYRRYFERYLARFTAEQPAIGMPYLSSLRKFMTDEDVFGEDTRISEYHTKNNPGLGKITLYGYVERMAGGMFGSFTSGKDRLYKMQLLQTEWIRMSLELFRRNMWYSSGIIYWMFDDCWPAANGWSMVDYYTAPKPAYYAFKRCAADLIASFEEKKQDITLCICNTGETFEGEYRVSLYHPVTGEETVLKEESVRVGAEQVSRIKIGNCSDVPKEKILLCDVCKEGKRVDRAFFLPQSWYRMNFPVCDPEILREDEKTVALRAPETIPTLMLDRDCILSENGCFLKKGEEITLYKL